MTGILKSRILKKYFPFFILIITILLLRFPSFFEPHWYFDEGVYSLFGRSIANGEIPYQYIWDHKPPGIYLIYTLSYYLPFGILLGAKILAFLSASISSILLFLIAKKKFPFKVAYTSAFLLGVFSSLPFFDGNQANGEIFFLTPVLLGIYLIKPFSRKSTLLKILIAGIAFGVAASIKQVAAIEILFAVLILFQKNGSLVKNIVALLLGSVGTFFAIGSLPFFLGTPLSTLWYSVIEYNLFYTVSRRIGLIFSLLKILLLASIVVIYFKRRALPYFQIFLWFLVDSIGVLAGGQPFPHYLIQIMPVSSLILALSIYKKYSPKLISITGIVIALFFVFIPINSYTRTITYGDVFKEWNYYPSFFKSFIGLEADAFDSLFSERWGTDRNRKVINYLNKESDLDQAVYVWGGGTTAWLYYDLNRKIPSRYISFLHTDTVPGAEDETIKSLRETKPKYIITTPRQPFPELAIFIESDYSESKVIDDVVIYKMKDK